MNEQIKQLVEQARVQDRGYFIYQYGGPAGHQSVEKAIDLEKFAQLIVRECLYQVGRVDDMLEDEPAQKAAVAWVGSAIAGYFGVEP